MILPPSSHRTFSTSPVISDCTIFEKEVSTSLAVCLSTCNLLWWASFNLTWTCLLIQMMGSDEPVGSFLNNYCSSLIVDPSREQLLLKGADFNPTWKYLVRWKKGEWSLIHQEKNGQVFVPQQVAGYQAAPSSIPLVPYWLLDPVKPIHEYQGISSLDWENPGDTYLLSSFPSLTL
jgi:hypothetical protein